MHGKLLFLFPDYQQGDWILHDDGAGSYIKRWNRAEMQPSQATLDSVTNSQEEQGYKNHRGDKRLAELDDLNKALIQVLAPKLGMTPQALRQEIRQELKK